jgi:23S rRNA (cytidine2498-2'-O)-methyltransferase
VKPDLVALAKREFDAPLTEEVGSRVLEQFDRLYLLKGKTRPLWAQNIWLEPEIFKFASISQAAKHLREIQRNWWLHSVGHHRRAQLIQEQLPPLKPKPIEFLSSLPKAPLGSWTLLDESTVLYSKTCTSPFPDGEIHFIENKTEPPSRAYLKLWEALTVLGRHPTAGEKVLDLGSSPGGWTWVLDQLGCDVLSVDKAPLAPDLKLSNRVTYKSESAFALEPVKADWLFSDIICYPERLLSLVKKWRPVVSNMVCTIKFQGPTDHGAVKEFAKLENSQIRHLFHNKHELTLFLGPVGGQQDC